jgi:hypothetical protein
VDKNGLHCAACIFYKEITKNFRQNEADETGIFIVIKMKIENNTTKPLQDSDKLYHIWLFQYIFAMETSETHNPY